MRRWYVRLAAALVIAYATLVGWLYIAQRHMVFLPELVWTDPAAAGLPNMQTITVQTQDGLALRAWYAKPPRAGAPVVLFLHGNGGSNRYNLQTAHGFLDDGYGLLMAEYRGYAGNPGFASEQGLYNDARAYMHFLTDHERIIAPHIVIVGQSLGTGVAVHLASENPQAASLILLSPFTSLPDAASIVYPYVPCTC